MRLELIGARHPCGNLAGKLHWNCPERILDIAKLYFAAFQEALMVLKKVLIAGFCATAFVWSSLAVADEYRADEFLGLDLSTAVLSPRPLGPAASFTPGPLDVTVDQKSNRAQVTAEPKAEPKVVAPRARVAHARAEPRLMARTKLARHHRNPLDAQALDTRIQVWPCKSGGICNWKR
jgi:hypothetical protein